MGFGVQNQAGDFEAITEDTCLYKFYTRDVCEACNNGWMSRLEQRAQKILAPLLEVPIPRNEYELVRGLFLPSAILTQWLLKTCATFGNKWSIRVPSWILEGLPSGRIPPCVYADACVSDQSAFYMTMSRAWNVVVDDQIGMKENDDSFRLTWQGMVSTRMRKDRGHDPSQRAQEACPRVVILRVARTLCSYKNSVAGRINPTNRLDTAEVAENRLRCLYLLPSPA
jgi:hypothetical protein